MRLNGAEIIIKSLERQGVNIVAGIPGGSNLPLYDALHKSTIRHILARHEQGAGFIAHGMARSTGRPAVCFATSGPGVTNLVTAIADAKLDSVPLVAITGQVARPLIGTDAFQEIDTYTMTLPITKHNFLVRGAEELLSIVPRAFAIASSGRPGPVLIDVPKDVQLEAIDVPLWPEPALQDPGKAVNSEDIQRVAELIRKSKRPALYVGGGISASRCHGELYMLARKNSIPVAMTLMGLGSYPPRDPLSLGLLGMHGALSTNRILDEADLLLAFGVRFDDRAVGKVEEFCPNASVVHVDIDGAEINKIKRTHHSIVGDAGPVIRGLLPLVDRDHREIWVNRIKELKALHPFPVRESCDELHPLNIVRAIGEIVPPDTIITTDVGQHQMWVAQAYPVKEPRTLLTSGGLGTMGFGLPAAIGASLANPGRPVICISGDGSFQMNVQELATLAELNLPVTIIIMNNGHLGLVRQQQELFYQGNFIASRFDMNLDFAALGRVFGIEGHSVCGDAGLSVRSAGLSVRSAGTFRDILTRSLSHEGPGIIDVPIHYTRNVLPMVPPGEANRHMIGGENIAE